MRPVSARMMKRAMDDLTMENIYREYSGKVLRYVRSSISNPQDAEDLCSSVFLKIQRGLPLYDRSKSSISTWIYAITRNAVVDFYRRTRTCELLDEEIACTEDGLEQLCNNETLDELAAALEQLPLQESQLIVLHYYSGKTLKEIANQMQMSYSNLKLLHRKALSRLKKMLRFNL